MKASRRDMVKQGLSFLALSSVMAAFPAYASGRRRKKGDEAGEAKADALVDPNIGMAKNVNYQHDKAKITDEKLKVSKQGVEYKDQLCSNCILYTDTGNGQGKCTLFPVGLVKAEGWCTSWAKKA